MQRAIIGLICSSLLCALLLGIGGNASREVAYVLLAYGDALLPIILGGVAVSIVMSDPCRELWLVMPYPLWRVALGRIAILLVVALLLWAMLVGLGAILAEAPSQISLLRVLIGGMVTCFWFSALGFWAAIRLRSVIGGGVLCAALWAGPLLFRAALLSAPPGLLLHPFLTLQALDHPLWPVNRMLLLSIALALFFFALRRLHDAELLLPHEGMRDE